MMGSTHDYSKIVEVDPHEIRRARQSSYYVQQTAHLDPEIQKYMQKTCTVKKGRAPTQSFQEKSTKTGKKAKKTKKSKV